MSNPGNWRKQRIQIRRGDAALWTNLNPTLLTGEWALETDTKLVKLGDGQTEWNSLEYWNPEGSGGTFVVTTDARLSDSREWSASTVTQAEAEAGSSTTRRAFTAERVFQAIAAWWDDSSAKVSLDALDGHSHGNITNDGKVGSTANIPLITTTDGLIVAGSFGTAANTFCEGNDSRLSDSRDPTTHEHPLSELEQSGASSGEVIKWNGSAWAPAADSGGSHSHGNIDNDGAIGVTANLPLITTADGVIDVSSFGTSASTFCEGNDSRLSDARTPTSHTHGNITNDGAIGVTANLPLITTSAGVIDVSSFGTSANTFCEGNDSRLSDARTPTSHAHGNITNVGAIGVTANLPVITTTSGVLTTGSFGTSSNTFCEGDDSRLSDARTPTSHEHAASAITSGTLDISRIPTGTTSSTVCIGNDSRLSDARTPTSHGHGNITNAGAIGVSANLPIITTASGVLDVGSFGTSASTFCEGNDSRLSDSRTPTSHGHGNITNAGAIGVTSNLPVITTTSGVLTVGSFGTGANTFCEGDDSRLSDARTPTTHAHAASDVTSGTFAIGRIPTGTTSSTVCIGNDSRLSDARTPTSHTHGNITNAGAIGVSSGLPIITTTSGVLTTGSFSTTSGTFCEGDDSRLSDSRTPTSHTHGNITNAGAIGASSGLPIITTTSGVLTTGSFGTTSGTFCEGDDSRIGGILVGIVGGRLTLESGVPISTTDQTAKTTVYFTPDKHNQIALYDGSNWGLHSFTERSLSLSGYTADTNYDVFIYDNSGTITLESVAWTNDTTRATALDTQDGVYIKSGATTRRYLGTIRITATTGQCEDSTDRRFVWNYYNQTKRQLQSILNAGSGHTYTTTSWRSYANSTTVGSTRNEFVVGLDHLVSTHVMAAFRYGYIIFSYDSTTVPIHSNVSASDGNHHDINTHAFFSQKVLADGYHYVQAMEYGAGTNGLFHWLIMETNILC